MNILYDNDGHGINASSATWSVQEWLGRKGMQVDFNNKIIKNIGNYELSAWDVEYLKNTYAYFNIDDYKIIKDNTLKLDDFSIMFDFKNNILSINNKNIKVDAHTDNNKPILKILKTKIKVYNGLQGLVKIFTDGFYKEYELLKLCKAIA